VKRLQLTTIALRREFQVVENPQDFKKMKQMKGHRMAVVMSYEPLAIQLYVATPMLQHQG
jgi:hypothetical protein